MSIGTAVPDASQLSAVRHYFIRFKSVTDYYTAGMYEEDAVSLAESLFAMGHETLVMCGGSMFYIDAVCKGLDSMPDADPLLRAELSRRIREEGLESLRMDLRRLDPEAYSTIDIANPQRVLRAVEVCMLSGKKFSSFKLAGPKKRDFEIEKIGLRRPREELYARINSRVGKMLDAGLVDEVRGLEKFRGLPSLNTVGYKEIFDYLDGKCSLDEAAEKIRLDTRHYAKRQLTWWRRDPEIRWIDL